MNNEAVKELLIYNRVTNYTPKQKRVLLEKFGSAQGIFSEREKAEAIFQKPFKINGKPLDIRILQEKVERELGYYKEKGIEIIDFERNLYPQRLKYIYDPPPVLFAQGKVELLQSERPVGIVGSRKASNGSINLGYSVSKDLAKADTVVISGLASGIDYYAHKGVLDGEGKTIAVLGNGIDIVYPKDNTEMYKRIREQGLLITEFPLGTPPFKQNFPMRNRIISGLSLGVVVVEASNSSGALITAMYALEQGREVMAFPGRALSENFGGNNRLIKEGAHLVENASDILSILGIEFEDKRTTRAVSFTALEQEILSIIGDDMVSIEEIERVLSTPVSKIASALMMLELKCAVVQYPGKIFSRVQEYAK